MKYHLWVLILAAACAISPSLQAQTPPDAVDETDSILLPYPERIQPLMAPVNARLRYGKETTRRFVTDIIWGPENAPGLYRMRAAGSIKVENEDAGPVVHLDRDATSFTFGPKQNIRNDAGRVIGRITPLGSYRQIELQLVGLDTKAHRDQFAMIGTTLIDTGRIPAFRRLSRRTGPDDTGGPAQAERERIARIEILESMQPMFGMVLSLPEGGLATGERLTVLRRDLGDLFRGAGPIPLRVEGEVKGLADVAGRRMLVVKLDRAPLAPPMRALVDGHALIDIETGLPETVIAEIELVILQGTDVTVFKFVERRALLPETVQ